MRAAQPADWAGIDTELIARAKRVIPGGSTVAAAALPEGEEFLVERAEGATLHTTDGRQLVDFVMGGGPLILGHAHPAILKTIAATAPRGTHHFALHRRAVELAERICELVPSAEAMRFTGSGTEATFHALRLARAATGRSGIIKFDGAYHGHHDQAVWSFESGPSEPRPVPASAGIQRGTREDIVVLPFNDSDAIRDVLRREPDRFAAVIVEPVQRAVPAEVAFLEAVREACDATDTVLVFDEIVTGFRLAPGGAQERFGVLPDLTTLGKALAGGLPLAALAGRRSVMQHLGPSVPADERSFHCGTFNGYLLGVECSHTTLDVMIEQDATRRLDELGQEAVDSVARVFADAGVPATTVSIGGLFQTYFGAGPIRDADTIRATDTRALVEYHRLLLRAGVYKLAPKGYVSLAHGADEIAALVDATDWSLRQMADL
jgi:glutamate-1-semialdehyde 2,1-aminomutase